MGRQRFNKLEHIEKSNVIFENKYLRTKGLLKEQLGTNGFGCDLSCIDISDPATDNMVAQGGGPNSIQPYDATATYAPGDVVCYLDPGTNVTNIFVASANSGQLVPGGGQYPAPEEFVTAFFYPLTNPNDANSYYWEPGVITMACGGNATSGTTSGDWWCDPTGQYVSATGSPCLQSPNQPQSYFTGPSIDQQTCEASCGGGQGQNTCMDVQTEVCDNPGNGGQWPCLTIDGVVPDQTYIGKVIDAGSTNSSTGAPIYFKITNINPSTSAPFGTQDFPEVTAGCPGSTNSSSNCDFSWTSSCSQTHLQTGGQNSWTNFLSLRETGFNSVGCQHLQQLVNWTTNQLNVGVTGPNSANPGTPLSPVQISRKTEQLAWAQCQANECGCSPLNVPALTGGNTPTGNNSHEKIVGTICACVGDCSSPSATIGGSISMQSATHQCNGQMCTQSDIGETFDYADGSKTLTFVLTSFSIPGVFGVSETPGIDMPSATCPTVPTPPPTDPDLIDPEVPTGKDTTPPPPQKKIPKLDDVKTLNEERERMKQMWKHKL